MRGARMNSNERETHDQAEYDAAAAAANDANAAADAAAYAYAAAAADARLASLAALIDEFDRLTGSAAEIVEIPWDAMVAVVGAVA